MEDMNIIEARGIGKEFGGVWVLRNVDFDLRKGEIHALVGENGAGKSTFIKMLSGVYSRSEGKFLVNGEEKNFKNARHAEEAGIRTVHQELNIIPWFTAYENIFVGSEISKKGLPGLNVMDDKEMIRQATDAIHMLNVDLDVRENAGRLSPAMKKIVEICKVLIYSPQVIVFDEPTTSLSKEECDALLKVIEGLKEHNISIIYISHNLEEIKRISDRVTVFRDGSKVGTLDKEKDEIEIDTIIKMMLGGKKYDAFKRDHSYATDEVVMKLENVTTEKIHDVSFELKKGEILGIAGVVGAGKTETARAIFGLDKVKSGKITMFGKSLTGLTRNRIRQGLALVPEERQAQGLVLNFPISENTTLVFLDKWCSKLGIIKKKAEKDVAEEFIQKMGTKTTGPKQVVKYLSGGNQQKVVLSKWMAGNFQIGIFDDPCRGIDIKAKEDIYILMDRLAKEGKSLIMISGYMPELVNNCDRVIVMNGGYKVAEFEKGIENFEEQIFTAMLGGSVE